MIKSDMVKRAFIFDLDGVIVDTAKYHYLAWKRLADELGIDFNEHHNERLKGVSRMASLSIILELGGLTLPADKMEALATRKNNWYVEYIEKMTPDEILPGVVDFVISARGMKILTAIGSASKNTPMILERTAIKHLFDAVADGNNVSKAKPDPEVFLKAADLLGVDPMDCVVFEDAQAGIEAAKNAGMRCVAIGSPLLLKGADINCSGLHDINIEKVVKLFSS
jgi:beta-phosphoglucomutase